MSVSEDIQNVKQGIGMLDALDERTKLTGALIIFRW